MGSEPQTLGLDDVTMDVDCLLVEPLDENVSMDSVMGFNEKMTGNSLDLGSVSRVGQSGAANARDKGDIPNEEVLDAVPSGAEFQIHDHYCSMGDDYLLGVEFAESITNIDYGSGDGLQVSVSDSQIQVPSALCFFSWKSEIIETSECQNDWFNAGSFKLNNVPNILGCGMLAEDNSKNAPETCMSQDINYRSGEGFHASVSDRRTQGPDAVCFSPWKSEMKEMSTCQNGQSNTGNSGSNDDSNLLDRELLCGDNSKKSSASCTRIEDPSATCTIDVPNLRVCKLILENVQQGSTSCISHNMGKVRDKSSHSSQNIISDENEGRLSPSDEMLGSLQIKKNDEEMTEKVDRGKRLRRRWSSTASVQGSCDVPPIQKRLRKPTQRYIDEQSSPITPKKRRESSSALKDEYNGVKVRKKCDTGSKATRSDEEEFSIKAIQVPFGSIVNQECPASPVHVMLHDSDRTWKKSSRDGLCAPLNQKKKKGDAESSHFKKSDDHAGSFPKKTDDCVNVGLVKKRSTRLTMADEKKNYGGVMDVSPKKKDSHLTTTNKKKKDDWVMALSRKTKNTMPNVANDQRKRGNSEISVSPKKVVDTNLTAVNYRNRHDTVTSTSPDKKDDNCGSKAHEKKTDDEEFAAESPEQVSGRRKNHRLWTISEVRKLLDGVSQYGVGRWSRIKKLLFASSPHRTSVDLKDKWRNLLKASGLHDQSRNGEKKRKNVPWRPLPKSILRKVRELASMHPYPKGEGRRVKIARKNIKNIRDDGDSDEDDSDGITDITLSDYRRILQSTNGG